MIHDKLFMTLSEDHGWEKVWLFPLSLLVHVGLLGSFIVLPLLNKGVLPNLQITDISLKSLRRPALPPLPQGGQAAKPAGPAKISPPERVVFTGQIKPIPVALEIDMRDFNEQIPAGSGLFIDGAPELPDYLGVDPKENPFLKQMTEPEKSIICSIVTPPRKVHDVAPVYPVLAQKIRLQGIVKIEAQTDAYGKVKTVRIVSGHTLLIQAAVEAVKQWIFEPYTINSIPKPVRFSVEINFKLK